MVVALETSERKRDTSYFAKNLMSISYFFFSPHLFSPILQVKLIKFFADISNSSFIVKELPCEIIRVRCNEIQRKKTGDEWGKGKKEWGKKEGEGAVTT